MFTKTSHSFVFILLIFFVNAIIPQTTTQIVDPNEQCLNGGECQLSNCQSCVCEIGFAGVFCEIVLTKIDGTVTYSLRNENSAEGINYTELRREISSAANTNYTGNDVKLRDQSTSELSIDFTFYIIRPASWVNYTSANEVENLLQTQLSLPTSTERVVGLNRMVTDTRVTIDVDECASNWSSCNVMTSVCVNLNPEYTCECKISYQWNGVQCIPITCKYDDAPKPPSLSIRTFGNENGTLLPEPGDILPYGTSVEFICERNYDLVDKDGNQLGVQTSACQLEGWTPVIPTQCSMNLEFRLAIGITIVSVLIIVVVISGFIGSYCVKMEHQAKAKKQESSMQNLSVEAWADM